MLKLLLLYIGLFFYSPNSNTTTDINKDKYFISFTMDSGIFDMDNIVIISNDTVRSAKYATEIVDSEIKVTDFNVSGVCFISEGRPSVMWIPHIPQTIEDVGIVNHELLHLSFGVLRYVGIKLCHETEEVYAYFLQHLTKQFYTTLSNLQ